MGYMDVSGVGPWIHEDDIATSADLQNGKTGKVIDAALMREDQIRQDVAHEKLSAELSAFKDLMGNNITTNQYYEDFSDINEIVLIRGNYDPLRQRLDCSYVKEVVE